MLWQCQFYLGYKAPINEGGAKHHTFIYWGIDLSYLYIAM